MFRLIIISIVLVTVGIDVTRAQPRSRLEGMTLYKTVKSWEDANRICHEGGNVLASPITDNVLSAMKSFMGVKNTMYFIGVKSSYPGGPFVSLEGVPLEDMTLDVMDMIDAIDQQDGDCLAMNSDIIRAVPCGSRLPFMCYDTHSFNITNCGPENEGYKYSASQRSCYKIHAEQITWQQAEQTCTLEGAYLVVIDSNSEAHEIVGMMKTVNWIRTWIGLRDLTGKGDWVSVHGKRVEDLYNIWWNSTKPQMNSICGQFHSMELGYRNCCESWPFICEKMPTIYTNGKEKNSIYMHCECIDIQNK